MAPCMQQLQQCCDRDLMSHKRRNVYPLDLNGEKDANLCSKLSQFKDQRNKS